MPDTHPLVTIQIVVHNGRRYVRHCLDAVCAQTYPSIEVVVLDNSSADGTADIVATHYPKFHLIRHHENIGMWPGQELVLKQTRGAFVLALSVDVLLDPRFVERAVAAFIADPSIAAVQSKTFQYRIEDVEREGLEALHRDVIDTCGFGMTHARKVLNIGHYTDGCWSLLS
jgi:GT2 family glycosyltransferase